LTFDQYQQICRANGEVAAAEQEKLAFYLHSLGIVLNYKDDPRLSDTHVLNPHWVTSGIYTILNAPRLAEQHGVLLLTDLSKILDHREYPRKMHHFLFDLMRKFELCFPFPDDENRYLIPELLPVEEPEATREFRPAECLNFQYHYPILPEGLLPRFIVRTHVLSEGQARWRTGVVLEFEDCRALVKADVQDRRVSIAISGNIQARRRLLAVVRADFERIHASIEKLQPDEMVPVPDHPDFVVPYEKLVVMEASGEKTFKEVIGKKVVTLDVQGLLNGVDLEGARRRTPTPEKEEAPPLRLFIS
jgi:internalin A